MYYFRLPFIIVLLFFFALNCEENKVDNQDSSQYLVLKGATLFDGNGNKLEYSVIVIKDNKIEEVGTTEDLIPENSKIKDVSGKFITPGLVDAHVHFFQTGFFDARPDALNLRDSLPYEDVYDHQTNNPERYYEAYLRSGITAVYDVGAFTKTLELLKDTTNLDRRPNLAIAGPLLTPFPYERIGGFNVPTDSVMYHLNSPEIGKKIVNVNTDRGATGIKIWSLNTKDSIFMKSLSAADEATKEVGNHLIVHATTLEQAKAALQFNTKLLVHSVEDTIIDQEFINLALKNGTYYNPTIVVGPGYIKTYKAVLGDEFKIDDPNNVLDSKTVDLLKGASGFANYIENKEAMQNSLKQRERRIKRGDSIMAINLRKVHEAGIPVVVGTDAGNPGTLHGVSIFDEMEAMQKAGISASDLIVMATKNGAEAMQQGDKIGTVERGKTADLVILDKDPSTDISNMRSLTEVMRNGKLIDVTKDFDK